MEATARAVVRLTETHTEVIDGAVGESAPLLDLLREARYPNLGKTRGGGGNGDVLDMQAMTMYENIDGIVRSWVAHYREHHTGDLIPLVKRLYEIIKTEHAGDRLDNPDRMYGMFTQWEAQIDDYFDPPNEYELTAVCPDCGAGRIANDDGAMKWAVRVPVKVGRAVVAECHACGRMWAGRDDLTDLAERMGVEVDWIALREMTGDTTKETTTV